MLLSKKFKEVEKLLIGLRDSKDQQFTDGTSGSYATRRAKIEEAYSNASHCYYLGANESRSKHV